MKFPLLTFPFFIFLTACTAQLQSGGETVLGEGKIKVLNKNRLLIQEKTSVLAMDFEGGTGSQLANVYRTGQLITLIGTKSIDKNGNSVEIITALVFEDGRRINIAG